MLRWAFSFLVIALVAGVLGFSGVAGVSMDIAKILFFIFLAFFLGALVLGMFVTEKLFGNK